MSAAVTVIILAYKTTARLKSCVDAICNDPFAPQIDLRIVLNSVPPAQAETVHSTYSAATVYRSPVNLGFAGGCNFGARDIRTPFIAFVNDDARVKPGWLRALLRLANQRPEAAAFGSRIVSPEGSLQEAGSRIWRDGSTSPVGCKARHGAYNAVREVDFCSANGLLLRTTDWNKAGGFDESYHPAYYEDVDLCMALRHRLGRKILYEPRSVIEHDLSASSDERTRRFLFTRHRALFKKKWSNELPSYPAPHSPSHNGKKRILFIDDRAPDQGVGSGFGRFTSLGRDLTHERFEVTFVATAERARWTTTLQDAGIEIVPSEMLRDVLRHERFDAVIASRPHNYMGFVPEIIKRHPDIVKIYDAEALFFLRQEREAHACTDPHEKPTLLQRSVDTRNVEQRIMQDASLVVTPSADELRVIQQLGAKAAILQLPFMPAVAPTNASFDDRHGVIFAAGWLGGSASPNVSALRWLTEDVMPLIWQRNPNVHVYVTGANPPPEALVAASERVVFTGYIENLRTLYEQVSVAAVPTTVGSGTKVKLVEALQYGVPVVATPVGAEGLPKYGPGIAIATDAREFAGYVAELLYDKTWWDTQRLASLELASELAASRPGWDRILEIALSDA